MTTTAEERSRREPQTEQQSERKVVQTQIVQIPEHIQRQISNNIQIGKDRAAATRKK